MNKKPAYSKYLSNTSLMLVLVTIALFLLLLPLALKVTFMQNDDWVYYEMVGRFLKGDFTLHPHVAAAFYMQGLMATLFALVFGLSKLPILTFVISCLNFLIFSLILHRLLKKSFVMSLLGGLLFFANPFHIYSVWSFMTENYFIFFLLCSTYFIYSYVLCPKTKTFFLANIFIIFGYLVRQLSLIVSLGFALYLLLNKKYKQALLQFGILGIVLFIHYNFFPLTPAMYDGNLEFMNILNLQYLYTNVAACLIYVAAFTLPLIILVLIQSKYVKKYYVLYGLFFIFSLVVTFKLLNPKILAWGEFPYFQNTVERKGFYPRDIEGTKYGFRFMYDLYSYWELIAKLGACLLATYLFIKLLEFKLSPVYIFFATYMGILIVTPDMYDRYLLPLITLALLFLFENLSVSRKVTFVLLVPFLAFILFYSYQFSMDFVIVNNYIWSKSKELVSIGVPENQIYAGYSWRRTYGVVATPTYKFSYDSLQTRPENAYCWVLADKKEIEYPLNMFIKPSIYLYKHL